MQLPNLIMPQLSWFVNKIKLLIGLIKHRAPGTGCPWPHTARWLLCPVQQLLCRDKGKAAAQESFILLKTDAWVSRSPCEGLERSLLLP